MFEKTLSDLVKGLRSNKRRESEFVSKCIAEIKVMARRRTPSYADQATHQAYVCLSGRHASIGCVLPVEFQKNGDAAGRGGE